MFIGLLVINVHTSSFIGLFIVKVRGVSLVYLSSKYVEFHWFINRKNTSSFIGLLIVKVRRF